MRKHQAAPQVQKKISELFVAARQLDAEGIDIFVRGATARVTLPPLSG
jgi:hypothetical protein